MSLTKILIENQNNISFHTPGHNSINLPDYILKCDTTELNYSDNLLNPTDKIKVLEKKLASVYQTGACFISTNGATNSIFQAFYALKSLGKFLLVGQMHSSCYNACRLYNIQAYHVDNLDLNAKLNSDIKVVVITSPNYFGNTKNLEKISLYCKQNNLVLLVDASHGSHFQFSQLLPVSATKYADMVIHSLHKTTPVLTGGSVLCVNDKYINNCMFARKMIHSSSPSYPILCSIENMVNSYILEAETSYKNIKLEIDKFANKINKNYILEKTDDFTRLVISSKFDGHTLYDLLSNNYKIDMEMAYENKIVGIITPYNYQHLHMLANALNQINDIKIYKKLNFPCTIHKNVTLLDFSGEVEFLPIDKCIGRLAFSEIGFYPPGVPLLYSHDLLTKDKIEIIKNNKQYVFGLVNDTIPVVK